MARICVAERRHNYETLVVRIYQQHDGDRKIFTYDLEWLSVEVMVPPACHSCADAQAAADAKMAQFGHHCSDACSEWGDRATADSTPMGAPFDASHSI